VQDGLAYLEGMRGWVRRATTVRLRVESMMQLNLSVSWAAPKFCATRSRVLLDCWQNKAGWVRVSEVRELRCCGRRSVCNTYLGRELFVSSSSFLKLTFSILLVG
jgi:hypothetical protein